MSKKRIFWNTYDPLGMNRVVKFPELFEICLAVFAPESKSYTSKFYFLEHLAETGGALRAGPHSENLEYASCDLSFAGFTFKVEYATCGDGRLLLLVTPLAVADPFTLIVVEVKRAWGLEGEVELSVRGHLSVEQGRQVGAEADLENNKIISFPCLDEKVMEILAGQDFHSVHYPGTPLTCGLYSSEAKLIEDLKSKGELNEKKGKGEIAALGFSARLKLRVIASLKDGSLNEPTTMSHDIDKMINKARLSYEENCLKVEGGPFAGCAQALTSAINWCACWDQINKRAYTPITRAWIDNYMVKIGFDKAARGPLIGLWDNLFNALLHSIESKGLAEGNIESVLADSALVEGEYPPNYIASSFRSGDRSQPPIGSLAVWKVYQRFGNYQFLKWAYPRLKKWHLWWKKRRDGNKDGLLEWGSTFPVKEPGNSAGELFGAKCESGMDNSPLFDEAKYDPKIGTLNLVDIGLNSLFAADARYLSKIARELGLKLDSKEFLDEYELLKERIDKKLFSEEKGAYLDRYWSGEFSSRIAPTTFYPLMAKIPTLKRARLIIKEHLLNRDEFWGEFVIPSISRDDQAFNDQIYWRGRIWPSMNYLVYLGLKEYELEKIAYEFAKKSVELFMREWKEKGHCHENYNALTGSGDDVPVPTKKFSQGSDRFYSWGALLTLMGIEEIIDVEMDEGIRFGCYFLKEKSILSNIKLKGSSYRIETHRAETVAFREGKPFFSSNPGTNIRNYTKSRDFLKFRACGDGKTKITILEFSPRAEVLLMIGKGKKKTLKANNKGAVTFNVELSSKYTEFVLKRDPLTKPY